MSATSPEEILRVVDEVIAGVRARGDTFVAEQVARFDGVEIAPGKIRVTPRDCSIAAALAEAIEIAIERIEAFHRPQLPESYEVLASGAVRASGPPVGGGRAGGPHRTAAPSPSVLRHRVRPLRRVGLYVPGGRAIYLSTLIMCAVPARIAGVRELVVATTPAAAARPELHYVCRRLGIREIYRAGGAAGIAALALGTETLERVDKIAGPGNAYVTAAKARLVGTVGIDMTAGPTELVVIADDSADSDFVLADLLAQAEHGEDSAVTLLTTSSVLASRMPPRVTTRLVASLDEATVIANEIAPEHVSLQTHDDARLAERIDNCGAIFCGPWSPVAAGDYTAGTNHVLPTAGSARFFSPLGVYDFVKRANVISLSAEELAQIAPAAATLARFEGLPAHAASCDVRGEVRA